MTIPTGSGTEVLKSVFKSNLSDTGIALLPAETNKIRTILSCLWIEKGSANETVNLWVDAGRNDVSGTGSTDIYIFHHQPLGSKQTLVFSDKFVLQGEDVLMTNLGDSGSVDVYLSYIEQDWT